MPRPASCKLPGLESPWPLLASCLIVPNRTYRRHLSFPHSNSYTPSHRPSLPSHTPSPRLPHRSCVKLGYLQDPFVHLFVKRPSKRPPLINRGYFSRVYAIRALIKDFLTVTTDGPRQIIQLGAGYDTSYFFLKVRREGAPLLSSVHLIHPRRHKCSKTSLVLLSQSFHVQTLNS
jgi:hypothetical protein